MDIRALGKHWESFARTDPLWAIYSDPAKRGGKWDPEEFFATGRGEIDAMCDHLDKLGVPAAHRTAMDFGCGVGRMTQALARRYENVVGVDISPTMVRLAEGYNRYGSRCRYLVNRRPDLSQLDSGSFDLVFTHIVLQHMEPHLSLGYIREFVRLLAPGGVAVFQVPFLAFDPAAANGVVAAAAEARSLPRRVLDLVLRRQPFTDAVMEMYAVPQERVLETVQSAGGRLLDMQEDGAAGGGHRSARYCVGLA
jgi:SAM-dependent methyltransferase